MPGPGRWYLRAGAWIGIGTSPGALMTGGGLAAGRDAGETAVVFLLGSALITALCVAQGLVGRRRRAATVELAEQTFASAAGPRLTAVLVTLGVACWGGFYVGVVAGTLGDVLGVGVPLVAVALGVGFWLVYRTGFSSWNAAVGATGILALAVGVLALTGVPGGGARDPAPGPALGSAVAGVGVVLAYAAVFAVRVADFTFDAPRPRDVALPGLALFTSLAAFLALGAAIQARAGSWDLADLVARSATPQAGALLLTLSVVAPSVSGLHSGALGLSRLLGWPQPAGAAVVAVAAALLGAARFDLRLLPFLAVLGAVVPPVVAVLMLRRDRSAGWHGWVAWGAGSGAALAAVVAGSGLSTLLGIAVAAALMLVLPISRRRPA